MDTGLKPLEFWGGVECTNARLAERRVDQLAWLDLEPEALVDAIAWLGVTRMRFPILWERVAPHGLAFADWSWTDRALARLREHGIDPIAGLVHHGSGPDGTNLLDPAFPEKLAVYAEAVVRRYPWISAYTPVNEPLTTARFSALYGIWYPHRSDAMSFARALFHQCSAVRRAMDAIRATNPSATLVQTEDLAKIHSTPGMAHEAAHQNERRWSSIDLLAGRGEENAVVVNLAERLGIDDLAGYACVPQIIGFNYYVTSERFLDERLERYSPDRYGTNGTETYADVTAARVCVEGAAGLDVLLREAADRYAIPLAVSEAHLGCTREEQIRWLDEQLAATNRAREAGVDVRAFTFWSLFGSREWNSLLRRADGFYEVGAFDARVDPPRPTAIAQYVRAVASGREYRHPATAGLGWWRAQQRFEHPAALRGGREARAIVSASPRRTLLVAGGDFEERSAFERACALRSLDVVALGTEGCDLRDAESVAHAVAAAEPWAVVLLAARDSAGDAVREAGCVRYAISASGAALLIVVAERDAGLIASVYPNALTVSTERDLDRNVHAILDLLIDGACGRWQLDAAGTPSKARSRTAASAAPELAVAAGA